MRFNSLLVVILISAFSMSCKTIKAYEKEYLLSPIMDDKGVRELGNPLHDLTASDYERLATIGGASSSSSSCPTCGG